MALLAACQSPASPTASLVQPTSTHSEMVDAEPRNPPPPTSAPLIPDAPTTANPEVASWETSHPFSLASLVERRLRRALRAGERRQINIATARALSDERGDLHKWRSGEREYTGTVRLVRRAVTEDGRVCARLHHEHQFDRRAVRGSIRICRKRGDSTAPWQVDAVRWIRLGNDFAEVVDGSRIATPAV